MTKTDLIAQVAANTEMSKKSAEQAVRKLGGVTGVTNQIVVKPRVESADIREKIVGAFRRNAELDGAGIVIVVDGSTVTLSGTVRAWLSGRAAAGRDAVLAVKEDW